ncbi:glycoside hydrolase family 52 protein [Gracilinema caldarium]|uniref:Xylan 1,4-beta-xylosidase n=1 Tax=Gracilinema caldarium (strain ATCC 51460 / DSM 7334 / H1) TaxID=744872 RepID=F8EZW2_GRAC1|nr:glycoside hydrolase family 52 protein [Gracilinema caldarium]AEJ18475.1 Xylan 1,4-beta-xylosidase [Gracilinema caldarium DSM 7334]
MGLRVSENDFYSLHGMWGAYASLILGRIGKGAGLVIGNVQPPQRGLFIGYRLGAETPWILPFCPETKIGLDASAYVDPDAPAKPMLSPADFSYFPQETIERSLSLSGEEWKAGLLSFKVTSFFGSVADPVSADPSLLRQQLRPALYITLTFDNSKKSEPLIGVFGMQGVRRPLSDSTNGTLLGFAHGTEWGFACLPDESIEEVMDWRAIDAAFNGNRPIRRLASEGVLRIKVNPGETKMVHIALGVYRDGIITSGLRTQTYYSSLFQDLEEVLDSALRDTAFMLATAAELDKGLEQSSLSDDKKFLLSHAVHSYCANTELLISEKGDPVFIVNEGEYQMMNTLDLTVDQAFFELVYSPWTVKNELDFFLTRSSYKDAYGIAFCHDQGVADSFTPVGTSVYELPHLSECFSYMSFEETLNWVLTACLYISKTGDIQWFSENRHHLEACLASMKTRDKNQDGIMDIDSDRCAGGSEITTYDSLDVSLGQARNNLYLAVKSWAAYVCIEALFRQYASDSVHIIESARISAQWAASTIQSRMLPEGYIPAVFESDNRSKIIPAIEGLVYPYICGWPELVSEQGPFGSFVKTLQKHLQTVLQAGSCLDSVSGGWKLSSTSHNTWLSKIFVNQFVAENILGFTDPELYRDAVHAKWLRNGSAQWAATDQVHSSDGHDMGSRLYPRLVTSILWYSYMGTSKNCSF